MNKKTIIALSITGALLASNVSAANKVADARGNAMGNTGVASADYLSAPFYNPALAANFNAADDFGFLAALGATANDADDSLTTIDDLQSAASSSNLSKVEQYLDELDENSPLQVTADLALAIAIPTNTLSVNVFAHGYTEIIASVDVSDEADIQDRYDASTVDMLAFGYVELGIVLAKEFTFAGEKVSFGITPKYQSLSTYSNSASVEDFDIEDYDESEVSKDAFNVDLGAMWYMDDFRAGLAIKDVIAQEIDVAGISGIDAYNLDTQVTVAMAYTSDYYTFALDADLTTQTRFEGVNDDTQFIRFGIEGNAWGWAQLRAGYEIDLEDTLDNTITAGIGISPFDVISIDIAGAYTDENQLGASANLAFTF